MEIPTGGNGRRMEEVIAEIVVEIVKDETPVPAGRAVVIEARPASEPRRALWLGRKDSNLRMAAPKAAALPLGDSPRYYSKPNPIVFCGLPQRPTR